jgi:hypothetical protein
MQRLNKVTAGVSGLLMSLALAIAVPAGAASATQAGPDSTVARPPAGVQQPRAAAAAAAQNKVLVGQNGNLSIITPAGDLLMYYHHGWMEGSTNITFAGDRGDGWNAFSKVVSFGVYNSYDNMYLATTSDGRMFGYYWKHNEQRWVNPAGTLVGSGWGGTQKLISGGNDGYRSGVYRITDSGVLYRYRFAGVPGEGGFFDIGGISIGSGFGGFQYVAARRAGMGTGGDEGEFYGVLSNGNLLYYRHDHFTNTWANAGVGQIINRGWTGGGCGFQTVQAGGRTTAGGDNVLYGVDGSGRLRWMQHYQRTGAHYWYPETACGKVVGVGWM